MSHRPQQVARWAPVLRGLLAGAGPLPRIRHRDAVAGATPSWTPSAGSEEIDALRAQLDAFRARCGEPGRVRLADGTTFEVLRGKEQTQLQGRVVMVTGAAQGFGREIALQMAGRGAHLVLGDLNRAGVDELARTLAEEGVDALALRLDVADEGSTAAAVQAAVEHFGGIDVLVANAGVVRAGALAELSPDDFDLVTRVNYRGYFLGVQAVAPVMAAQHRGAPQRLFDVVEVNSKSGLAGSARNSAYAGSKFGGIGLTQSFALELAGQGIKVNAVCPGNYLDGPLWNDPADGLFVQYLAAGKVPGATTVEQVREHYERQAPLGRGCRPEDVVRAICYAVEQQYETGQALAVTGGHTMLH